MSSGIAEEIEILGKKFLSRKGLARVLRLSPQTLACWAMLHKGPPVTKIGRQCVYDRDLVRNWIAQNTLLSGE